LRWQPKKKVVKPKKPNKNYSKCRENQTMTNCWEWLFFSIIFPIMVGMQRIIVRNKASNRFLFAVKTLAKRLYTIFGN